MARRLPAHHANPTPIAMDNSFDHLAGITKRPALLARTYRQQILDQLSRRAAVLAANDG
jgi:hypothetical protein